MQRQELIETVRSLWASGPVCVFQMGQHYAAARPNTAKCASLDYTLGARLMGTYERPHEDADVVEFLNRDLGA